MSLLSGCCVVKRGFQVSSFKNFLSFNADLKKKEFSPRMKNLLAFQEIRKPIKLFQHVPSMIFEAKNLLRVFTKNEKFVSLSGN